MDGPAKTTYGKDTTWWGLGGGSWVNGKEKQLMDLKQDCLMQQTSDQVT